MWLHRPTMDTTADDHRKESKPSSSSDDNPPDAGRVPSPGSSPTSFREGSPIFAFLQSLSPMKSDKRARYLQRFSMCSFPIPQTLFASPQFSSHGPGTSVSDKREEISGSGGDKDGGGGGGGGSGQEGRSDCFERDDDVQLFGPRGLVCFDQRFADPLPMEDSTSNFSLPVDGGESGVGGTSYSCSLVSESVRLASGVDRAQSEHEQHQCGIRQYLRFESALASENSSDGTYDVTNFSFPDRLKESCPSSNFKSHLWALDECSGTSRILQDGNCAQNVICHSYSLLPNTFRSPQNESLTNLVLGAESSRYLASNPILQEEEIVPEGYQLLTNDLYGTLMPSADGAFYSALDFRVRESGDASIPSSAPLAVDISQHSSALQLTQFNIQATPSQIIPLSENFDIFEESNQMSPVRIRKRSNNGNGADGCKYCTCKRSRCLKLYCECFSNGLYCGDQCSCENCMNKVDYEDTVLDVRKRIEIRNPSAFVSKVVERGTSSPANTKEELNQKTPSLARHRRGCNCKKSKCIKKYCECYQANVGCSEGCRCENCENPFGTKAELIYRRTGNQDNQSQQQIDILEAQNKSMKIRSPYQTTPTWEALSDISNLEPLSHPCLDSLASASRAKLQQESSPYFLASHLNMQYTPTRFTLKFDGSRSALTSENFLPFLHDLNYTPQVLDQENFVPFLHDVNYTPQVLDHISILRKAEAVSSKENHTSLPGVGSSLLQELRTGCKFSLQAVPSFPPLSPYRSSSPGRVHQIGIAKEDPP